MALICDVIFRCGKWLNSWFSLRKCFCFLCQFFETETPKESEEALEQRENTDNEERDSRQGDKDQQQTEEEDKQSSFSHRPLPLSPSWTNFEDCKFDDTDFSADFPYGLSPIAEEETALFKQHSDPFTSKDAVTDNPVGKQVVCEEDKSVSEEDNPFRKDSFIGLESAQLDTVEKSLNNSQSFNDPFYSKTESVDNTFGSCDHTTDSNAEEENPFRKDLFVLLQEQLASTRELVTKQYIASY